MNKNTLLAILVILIAVTVFNTKTYNKFFYENIYPRKPYVEQKNEQKNYVEKENKQEIEKRNESIDTSNKKDVLKNDTISNDTVKSDTVWIETDKIILGIQEKGAVIVSAKMKEYKYLEDKSKQRKKGDMIDILPQFNKNGAELKINGDNYNNSIFYNQLGNKNIKIEGSDEKRITFISKDQKPIEKTYVVKNGTYKIGIEIKRNDLSGKKIEIGWNAGIEESEKAKAMQQDIRTVHYSNGKNDQHLQMNKEDSTLITGNYKWVGITSKYFFVAIVNNKEQDADLSVKSFRQKNEELNKKTLAINYAISYSTIADSQNEKFWLYIGPNDYEELNKYQLSFDNNLFPVLGWPRYIFFADKWFPPLAEAVLWLLLKLYTVVKDYGIAILILTFLTKLITYPMMYSSMKSMSRMRDMQPKIQQMRDKHKNNPRKMNEELMKLYKKEGINPLNPGCLPMFLQMPIFIALFVVLRKAIELRGAETVIIPWVHDLSKAEVLVQLPWNIPLYGSNLALLPIIMAILTFFQNKMTIKDPNQKAMIYFMPIFMLVLFNSFSAGLVLYWTFSNALGIIQQMITDKQLKKEKK